MYAIRGKSGFFFIYFSFQLGEVSIKYQTNIVSYIRFFACHKICECWENVKHF